MALRVSLTSSLDGVNSDRTMEEMRQVLWERSFWTAAGNGRGSNSSGSSTRPGSTRGEETPGFLSAAREEQRLNLGEMQALCERLNVRMSEDDVRNLFNVSYTMLLAIELSIPYRSIASGRSWTWVSGFQRLSPFWETFESTSRTQEIIHGSSTVS